jgi:uridine kinase
MLHTLDMEKNYQKYLKAAILVGVLFKLLLMGLFSSDYQDQMFIPFVDLFLNGENPYQVYYDNGLLPSFPYPSVMLLVECIGGVFVTFLDGIPVFFQNLVFKLPILLADLLGLYYLFRISRDKRKYILALYFLSPIILYASYMHGQLDLIPTVFLVGAVYYLSDMSLAAKRERAYEWRFILFLTLALASKLHIAAALPLFFLYIYKRKGWKKAVCMTGIPVALTVAAALPFWGSGFVNMVLLNREQQAVNRVYLDYGNAHLLLTVLVLLFLYFQAFQVNQMNRDLLISMTGLLFSVFLAFVPAMPAWFIWIVPFFMLYLARQSENRGKMVLVYGGFNVLYLLYYVFFHTTQFVDLYFLGSSLAFLKQSDEGVRDIVFSLMVGVFLILVICMYLYGVGSNSYYRRRNRPFTIGIAGDSGAGKTRLLQILEALLSKERVLALEGDGDHKWERGDRNWEEMTHLNPRANYLYRQAEDLKVLRGNNTIKRVDYDHETGTFTRKRRLSPKPYVVLCGLHSLYLPQMRQVLDMKVYLDTDDALRCHWKLCRDQGERGHDRTAVLEQIRARHKDAEKYIYPQKQYADLVIRYFDETLLKNPEKAGKMQEISLNVEFVLDAGINVEPLLSLLRDRGVPGELSYDDLLHQKVSFRGEDLDAGRGVWAKTAAAVIPQIEDLTGGRILWEEGAGGLVQLMLLLVIGEIMKRD